MYQQGGPFKVSNFLNMSFPYVSLQSQFYSVKMRNKLILVVVHTVTKTWVTSPHCKIGPVMTYIWRGRHSKVGHFN